MCSSLPHGISLWVSGLSVSCFFVFPSLSHLFSSSSSPPSARLSRYCHKREVSINSLMDGPRVLLLKSPLTWRQILEAVQLSHPLHVIPRRPSRWVSSLPRLPPLLRLRLNFKSSLWLYWKDVCSLFISFCQDLIKCFRHCICGKKRYIPRLFLCISRTPFLPSVSSPCGLI